MKLRQSNIDRLDTREFDVLIVGGGINGAVSASSLTSRGVSVALIDRGDFGGETSQESSNLIWGGIKYLESFELGLVRKLCMSRNHLLRSYPSNVREIRFLTTLRKGFRHNRFTLFLGGLLYWLMGRLLHPPPAASERARHRPGRADDLDGGQPRGLRVLRCVVGRQRRALRLPLRPRGARPRRHRGQTTSNPWARPSTARAGPPARAT
jgi:glycerol-3-phosphate dehydrogenase